MNEILVSLYLYTYILLCDNTSSFDQLQDAAALFQVSIVLFAIFINAVFSVGETFIQVSITI